MWTMPFTKRWSAAVSRPLAPFRSCRPSRRAETADREADRVNAWRRMADNLGFGRWMTMEFFYEWYQKVQRSENICVYICIVFCFLYGKNYDCATAVCWLLFYMYVFMLCPMGSGSPTPQTSQSSREKRGMATNHNATVNLCQQWR